MVEVLSNLQFNFHHILPLVTKISEIYQDSENPVIHNGPKSINIAPVSQNEPNVTQNLPKLTKLTKIARIQSTTMDQSRPRFCQLVRMNQK